MNHAGRVAKTSRSRASAEPDDHHAPTSPIGNGGDAPWLLYAVPVTDALAPPTWPIRRGCPDCGLFQHVPPLTRGAIAECVRCGRVLRRSRVDPILRPLALSLTGLVLIAVALSEPLLALTIFGTGHTAQFLTAPVELTDYGMPELAIVVLATTMLVPVAKLLTTAWVLWGVQSGRVSPAMTPAFRIVAWLRPWAMVEVFMLGLFVAYTKLIDLARVDIGIAAYALGALVLVMAAGDATIDDETVWRRLLPRRPALPVATEVACRSCSLVCDAAEPGCPRCGAHLHARKPDSVSRCWAFLAAAAVLYIPANAYPVLTLIRLGRGEPATILGGVVQLAQADQWPLVVLVFGASVCVPVFKIAALTILQTSTLLGWRRRIHARTMVFRIVDVIGRWSMIDVFMISILTALVRMGSLASVYPGVGVISFCSVVILTMLAAASFDPRLMWDAADRSSNATAARREPVAA